MKENTEIKRASDHTAVSSTLLITQKECDKKARIISDQPFNKCSIKMAEIKPFTAKRSIKRKIENWKKNFSARQKIINSKNRINKSTFYTNITSQDYEMKKMVNVKMVNVKGKLQIKISKFKNPNLKSIKCITRQRTHQTGFRNFF